MKYKEIFRLKEMLEQAHIPFTFDNFLNGYCVKLKEIYAKPLDIDAVEHCASYGNENDLLEIMGALTVEELEHDSVKGWLSAEEVFKRFKYCFDNQTNIYKGK